jgi:hypothetical protein
MALFTTTLDLYGGVLWSGELQGFIIHEMMPSAKGVPRGVLGLESDDPAASQH